MRCACLAACQPCRPLRSVSRATHAARFISGRRRVAPRHGLCHRRHHRRPDRRRRHHVLRAQRHAAGKGQAAIAAPDEARRSETPTRSRTGRRRPGRRAPPTHAGDVGGPGAGGARRRGRGQPPSGDLADAERSRRLARARQLDLDAPIGLDKASRGDQHALSRRGTALQLSGRRANNPPPHQAEAPPRGASVVKGPRSLGTRIVVTAPITHPAARSPPPQPPSPTPEPGPAAARPEPAPDLSVRPVSQTPTEAIDYAALTSAYGALLGAHRAQRPRPRARRRTPRCRARGRDVRALEADRPREGRELDPPAVRRRAGRAAGARRAAGCATRSASC